MLAADEHGRVVILHGEDDELARAKIVPALVDALGERGVVESVASASSVRAVLERHVASEQFVAALICASDPTTAVTLIWELAEPGSRALFGARVLVVLGSTRRLASLPKRLLEAFEFLGVDDMGADEAVAAALHRVARLPRAPRPVDVLASVYRSAIARRELDGLLALNASVGRVVEVDPRELGSTARVGDRGPRPNPLWSHWISHGRTVELVGSTSKAPIPVKKARKQ